MVLPMDAETGQLLCPNELIALALLEAMNPLAAMSRSACL